MTLEKEPKVVVIGLDGATWSLIKPWADSGKLPTFEKLMKYGVYRNLKSTHHPVTFPAWECIFTGKNPGKLGVFDFFNVDCKNRSFNVNTPNSFTEEPVWKILNQYGFSTCMIGIPTSKVQAVKGVMIGGPFSNENSVYPKRIDGELKRTNYKKYPEELSKLFIGSSRNPPLDLIKKTISSRFDIAKYLLDNEDPDFLALVIFEIDNIQHFFWGDSIVYDSWRHIDNELGNFLSMFKDSIIVIVSDHGFAKLDKIFYISKFLEEKGLLSYNQCSESKIQSVFSQERLIRIAKILMIDGPIQKIISKEKLLTILSRFKKEEGRYTKGLERIIDWDNSKCIARSQGIYLNCSDNEKAYIKRLIKEELMKLEVIKDVLFKEDIYSGKYFDIAPDITVVPKDGVRILENPFMKDMICIPSKGWKADHTREGIFLIYNHNLHYKKIRSNINVTDIAPTILSIFGIDIP